MPCVNALSFAATKRKNTQSVKPASADINTSTIEKVKIILWSPPFKVPHPRPAPAAEKFIYMPGAGAQAVPVNSIPGYYAHQANTGPLAEAVRQARINFTKYGNYGGEAMTTQDTTAMLSRREQKKRLKAERKLAKLAQKARKHQGRISRSDLINAESRLGSTIFGPIPEGHQREFFHDQQNVWIWYEGWVDDYACPHQFTVRYEVRPSGVYKKLSAGKYVQLTGHELDNFRRAVHVYLDLVKTQLYANLY